MKALLLVCLIAALSITAAEAKGRHSEQVASGGMWGMEGGSQTAYGGQGRSYRVRGSQVASKGYDRAYEAPLGPVAAIGRVVATASTVIHDAAYWLAVRQGGPCGLTVERMILGRSDHMIGNFNPWLAREWGPHRFPITAPAPGMVAVWKNGSHVGVVGELHGDGTFSVTGSSYIRRVSLAQVWVVDARQPMRQASEQPARQRHRRYAWR